MTRFSTAPAFTSSFRKSLYRDGRWVQEISGLSRYRDVSAEFFARNPACIHRLVPWLNRELMALLRSPSDVAFMLSVLLDTVKRYNITSEQFYTIVSPFLGSRSRHFMHEFNSFARSPFDMAAYDSRAIYNIETSQPSNSEVVEFESSSSESSSGNESDSDVVEVDDDHHAAPSAAVINHIERQRLQNRQRMMRNTGAAVESSITAAGTSQGRLQTSRWLDRVRRAAEVRRLSELSSVAGPSTMSIRALGHLPPTSGDAELPAGRRQEVPSSSALPRPQFLRPHDSPTRDLDSDDGEVMIVSVDKPWRERSPIMLLSSDDEEAGASSRPVPSSASSDVVQATSSNSSILLTSSQEAVSSKDDKMVNTKTENQQRPEESSSPRRDRTRTHSPSPARHKKSKKQKRHKESRHSHHSRHRKRKHKRHRHRYDSCSDDNGAPSSCSSRTVLCSSCHKRVDAESVSVPNENHTICLSDASDASRQPSTSTKYNHLMTCDTSDNMFDSSTILRTGFVSSDDSSDDSTCRTTSVRSAVVLPTTFKKRSSGHKHSAP